MIKKSNEVGIILKFDLMNELEVVSVKQPMHGNDCNTKWLYQNGNALEIIRKGTKNEQGGSENGDWMCLRRKIKIEQLEKYISGLGEMVDNLEILSAGKYFVQ